MRIETDQNPGPDTIAKGNDANAPATAKGSDANAPATAKGSDANAPATAKGSDANAPAASAKAALEGNRKGFLATFAEWSEMIKLEHTVFALPFALSGLVLAGPQLPAATTVFWTVCAFAGARAAAMTLNRLIDAGIDARNPRTSTRAIAAGRIKPGQALFFAIGGFGLMIYAALQLPPLCLQLSPIAVAWLSFYSFTKRFTWLCHLVLGIAIGGASLGGWLAAGGALSVSTPWFLALAVATWVAGFDIIYALQDVDFDRSQRLHSIPAAFGIGNALAFSSALHLVTLAALIVVGCVAHLSGFYWLGTVLVGAMLVYEHKLVSPDDLSKINAAFFTTNGVVSIAAFVAILCDRIFPFP